MNERVRDLPALTDADVTAFRGDEHYGGFFDRDTEEQRWTPLRQSRSLQREWGLIVPDGMRELGIAEQRLESGELFEGEIWCYGDVPVLNAS